MHWHEWRRHNFGRIVGVKSGVLLTTRVELLDVLRLRRAGRTGSVLEGLLLPPAVGRLRL
jgi:hypothetical protein